MSTHTGIISANPAASPPLWCHMFIHKDSRSGQRPCFHLSFRWPMVMWVTSLRRLILIHSGVLHILASRGRYRPLLGWRPWRRASANMHPKTKHLMGVTKLSCDCGHVVSDTVCLIQNYMSPSTSHTLYIFKFNGMVTRSVFPLYYCKAPDLKHTCSSFLFLMCHTPKQHIYTTAAQSILSLISHHTISWCVMCYRWYIPSHSVLFALPVASQHVDILTQPDAVP